MKKGEPEVYAYAKAQMIAAINSSSGPEQKLFQHDLALLENVWEMYTSVTKLEEEVERNRKLIYNIVELCQLLKENNDKLEARIEVLEQKPVKKGLFG